MVKSAVRVRARFEQLVAESTDMNAVDFKARYEQFLTECQNDL
jgi:hypothetical protein